MAEGSDLDLDVDVLAATLASGARESRDLLGFLAHKFEGPLSSRMTVKRGGGLFSREKPVEEILLRFDEFHFHIVREKHGAFSARIQKEVRGIVLKTSQVPVEEWLAKLAQELAQQARQSEETHRALNRFLLE